MLKVFFILFLGAAAFAENGRCVLKKLVQTEEYTHPTLKVTGTMNTWRTLHDYYKKFGSRLKNDLASLGQEHHWVDLGSGQTIAMASFDGPCKKTGITYLYQRPNGHYAQNPQVNGPTSSRFRVLEGKFFETIPEDHIGKTDLITDLMGVFAYTERIDLALKKSLSILNEQGVMYIHPGDFNELNMTTIQVNGQTMNFTQWLNSIPGLSLSIVKDARGINAPGAVNPPPVIRLVLNNRALALSHIPQLEMIGEPEAPTLPTTIQIRRYQIFDPNRAVAKAPVTNQAAYDPGIYYRESLTEIEKLRGQKMDFLETREAILKQLKFLPEVSSELEENYQFGLAARLAGTSRADEPAPQLIQYFLVNHGRSKRR